MIGRLWRGWTSPADADGYRRFLTDDLLPGLDRIEGYRGAYVMTRASGDETEFVTLTLFESMADVRGFAGDQPDTPVIEPEAERLLSRYERRVGHYEIVMGPGGPPGTARKGLEGRPTEGA